MVEAYLQDLSANFNGQYPQMSVDKCLAQAKDVKLADGPENAVFCWDIDRGVLLRLGEKKRIEYAMLGFEELDEQAILEIYGDPPIFGALQWPATVRVMHEFNGCYWALYSTFE